MAVYRNLTACIALGHHVTAFISGGWSQLYLVDLEWSTDALQHTSGLQLRPQWEKLDRVHGHRERVIHSLQGLNLKVDKMNYCLGSLDHNSTLKINMILKQAKLFKFVWSVYLNPCIKEKNQTPVSLSSQCSHNTVFSTCNHIAPGNRVQHALQSSA